MSERYVRSCCDQTPQPGVYYRQARLLSDSTLTDQWFPVTRVPTVDVFKLYSYDVALCLQLLRSDAQSLTPGTICRRWDALVNTTMEESVCGAVSPPPPPSPPPANQPPVNSIPGAQTTPFQTNLHFSTGNGNLVSISDPDAGGASVQVQLTVTHGTLSLSGTAGLTFSVGDGSADTTMTFTGTMTAINTAMSGMQFSPTSGYDGAATLTIVTNDQGNTGTGGALSDTDVVNITVQAAPPVNDPPVNTVPGAQSTAFGEAIVFNTTNGNAFSIADPDVGGAELEVTLSVSGGAVTLLGAYGDLVEVTVDDGTTCTFNGTLADINTLFSGDGFQVHPGTVDDDDIILTIETNDQGNTGTGGALFDTDTVTIHVGADPEPEPCSQEELEALLDDMDMGDDILVSEWQMLLVAGAPVANGGTFTYGGKNFQVTFAHGAAGGSGTCAPIDSNHFTVVITRVGAAYATATAVIDVDFFSVGFNLAINNVGGITGKVDGIYDIYVAGYDASVIDLVVDGWPGGSLSGHTFTIDFTATELFFDPVSGPAGEELLIPGGTGGTIA